MHAGKLAVSETDWSTNNAVTPSKITKMWFLFDVPPPPPGISENQWAQATGSLVFLAEQQLADCSKQNSGCSGGLMGSALSFYETQNIATESSYPYTASDGTCKTSSATALEIDLLDAVSTVGPICVEPKGKSRVHDPDRVQDFQRISHVCGHPSCVSLYTSR